MRLHYAMVFVSDMARGTAFYRDVVGLPLRFESPHWTEFATDGATLALHLAPGTGLPGASSHDESAGSCRPGFQVTDLEAFHERMTVHGVRCVQAPREVFGARVAQYADPDGLIFSVGEERPVG